MIVPVAGAARPERTTCEGATTGGEAPETRSSEGSRLDRALEVLRKLSVAGGLAAALWVVLLFFLGAGIYSTFETAYGIPLFDFSVNRCLEYGARYLSEVLVALPLLLLLGVAEYFSQADLSYHVFFGLPLLLMLLSQHLRGSARRRGGRLHFAVVFATVAYMIVLLVSAYGALVGAASVQNVLLDPAVNVAIEHADELRQGMDPAELGIPDWDGFTRNLVLSDGDHRRAR